MSGRVDRCIRFPKKALKQGYINEDQYQLIVDEGKEDVGTVFVGIGTGEGDIQAEKEFNAALKPRTFTEPQLRHVLGNVVTDKLQSMEGGQDALQRMANGTHQQYADLANALDVKKPKALASKTGSEWNAKDFRRSTVAHGKELNPIKEMVARHMSEKHSPTEILQHTEHWVNPDATPLKPMSGLTERTMSALKLSEEAKNQIRASGASDAEVQAMLAKLSKRQLDAFSK